MRPLCEEICHRCWNYSPQGRPSMRRLLEELEQQYVVPQSESREADGQPLFLQLESRDDNVGIKTIFPTPTVTPRNGKKRKREYDDQDRASEPIGHSEQVDRRESIHEGFSVSPNILSHAHSFVSTGSGQRKALSVAISYRNLQAKFQDTPGLLLEGTRHDPARLEKLLVGMYN